MGAVWRRPLVTLALLSALLGGCSGHSSGRAGPPTSRTGGAEGPTTTTAPGPPSTLVNAWFSSDRDGWALSREPCPQPANDQAGCAVVWKTADGGESWARLSRLDVPPDNEVGPEYVRAMRFADAQHGWVYDRSLYATFNGGKRWQPVGLGNPVVALESVSSQMYALVGSCGNGAGNCPEPMRIAEGTAATGRWRFAGVGFDLPNTDRGTLIKSGSAVYALVSDYGSNQMFLARTTAGRWERRTPPCLRPIVAPIAGQDGLVAACLPGPPGGAVELQTSSDGGHSWAVVWQYSFRAAVTSLAVTAKAAVVALDNGDMMRTTDNGMSFAPVLNAGRAPTLQFVDAEHGVATGGPDAGRRLFRTADGGGTWAAVPLPR